MKFKETLLATAILFSAGASVSAETLKWARAGDGLTLDPHAQNEGPTITLQRQIMEPLVARDMRGVLVPALATEWDPSDKDPNVWVFKLRQGVKFHDGADFDSEDVVFSLKRAMSDESNYREVLASVVDVRAPDKFTVEIITDGPNPIMPNNLTNMLIMDKDWATANDAIKVQDYEGGQSTYAAKNANGTGAYKLISREPDVKTVMERFDGYWGVEQFPMEVSRLEYIPIQNAATRIAALLSGEVDFIQDVPVQDIDRVVDADGLDVRRTSQNRVIFLGMNQGDTDLKNDNVDGKNPFADVRVRRAMNMSINRLAIQEVVMRGQSEPAGIILPPFVHGWVPELDVVQDPDIETAKALMAEAGYADGFSIKLDCPNDRYINDEAICQAMVGMLAQIGIKVNLDSKPKAQHFPLINNLESDFYMLGWGVPTYDSEYAFNFLVHSKGEAYGSWNNTRYSNPEIDAEIESLASEIRLDVRDASIRKIWDQVQEDVLYLPIHHQVLNWGMKSGVDTIVDPEDSPKIKYFSFK
ncbi:peptide ABC transporter substrate-binding protein [Kiloniella spongiae]|uniref:Peptide ABC transporter substrate-binding protein n=1 Tax=Kiloniella spongiae TaxID=1489064 RepID=A0A0H2MFN0_9PROT|nr:ABC transporter substrate-binding protein [Kiloniella spongiae]KLN59572.1 peptide ABC transporter substrate-binding protein [Kiloniella spongiae]